MDHFFEHLLKEVSGQGLSMTFTLAACYYLHGKIKECEHDRKALWERLLSQQNDNEDRN